MNFNPMGTDMFFKSNNNNLKSVFYKCNACKKTVDITELRNHAENHNVVFKFFEWNKVLKLFSLDF